MCVEGSTAPGTYQPYNGAIVHEKDITPVLLWENANANADMSENTQLLSEKCYNNIKERRKIKCS